ncbi:MAG: hypothetical protein RLZZ490_335 [Cyanobacteriota bacterium]|jgi:hypothetical protein
MLLARWAASVTMVPDSVLSLILISKSEEPLFLDLLCTYCIFLINFSGAVLRLMRILRGVLRAIVGVFDNCLD